MQVDSDEDGFGNFSDTDANDTGRATEKLRTWRDR